MFTFKLCMLVCFGSSIGVSECPLAGTKFAVALSLFQQNGLMKVQNMLKPRLFGTKIPRYQLEVNTWVARACLILGLIVLGNF